jgi:hypothetical protein
MKDKFSKGIRYEWLRPIILAIWKADIRKIMVQGQAGQIVMKPYLENTQHKKGLGGVVQLVKLLPSKHEA